MFDEQTLEENLIAWKQFHIEKGHPNAKKSMEKFERAVRDFLAFNPKMSKSDIKPAVDYGVSAKNHVSTSEIEDSHSGRDQTQQNTTSDTSKKGEFSLDDMLSKGWDGYE